MDEALYEPTTSLGLYKMVTGWDLDTLTGTANKRATSTRRYALLRQYLLTLDKDQMYDPVGTLTDVKNISSFAKTVSADQIARLQALFNNICGSLEWKCKDGDKGKIASLRAFLKKTASKNNSKLKNELMERKEDKPLLSREKVQRAASEKGLETRWQELVRVGSSYLHQVALPDSEALSALLGDLKKSEIRAAVNAFVSKDGGGKSDDESDDSEGDEETIDPALLESWSEKYPTHNQARCFGEILCYLPRFPKTFFDEALGLLFFAMHNIPKPEVS
jgi:hypothetical protein